MSSHLDGLDGNLMLETFMKIYRGTANLEKVGAKYWALWMKNLVLFTFAGERNAPRKHYKKQCFDVFLQLHVSH